jgi:citrate lyase subunit beta / citryl-CoA lyase
VNATVMRSLMFVPAHRMRMVERALGIGEFMPLPLDVAMLDLEDGTPPAEKDAARRIVAAILHVPSNGGRGPARWVRVTPINGPHRTADLDAAVRPGLSGVVLPKVETREEVLSYDRELEQRERAAGLQSGQVRLIPMIETAQGLINAYLVASTSPRVAGLMFGIEDYALDLGLPEERVEEAAELVYARSAVVNAAVAAKVLPLDSAWPDFKNLTTLRRDALQARRLGFAGKSIISPGQLATINEVFSPSAEEIARARRVVQAFEEGETHGIGAISVDGVMIDRPVVERARRTLLRSG